MRKKTKLREKVVYWGPDGTDRDGQRKFAAAVELDARWEDGQIEVQTGPTSVWKSASLVYFLATYDADRAMTPDIQEGGFIWRGPYSRLASAAVPTDNAGVVQIERVARIPTRRNRQVFITAYG